MTQKEYDRAIDHEISWLKYYALRSTRELLNKESNLYKDLVSIGYTKKVIPLWLRCPYCIITSNNKIDLNTPIKELEIIREPRDNNNNRYTALEFEWLNPNKREYIIKKLND
jgi:hypothetical protein